LGIYNIFAFYDTYAKIDRPDVFRHKPRELDPTDEWLIAATNEFIRESVAAYEEHKPHLVVQYVETFVEALSNFYIRTNRRRFWKNSGTLDKANAYWSLYNAVRALTLVLVPITPFMAERFWRDLRSDSDPELCVVADFPAEIKAVETKRAGEILTDAAFVRDVISQALSLRSREELKLRQPLGTLFVRTKNEGAVRKFESVLRDEVNVKKIEIVDNDEKFNTPLLKLNFKAAGALLKGDVQKLKVALESLPAEKMADAVAAFGKGAVTVGEFKDLPSNIFVMNFTNKTEFVSATVGDLTVVLDTTLTAELVEDGITRELVRAIQVARQTADLPIVARISLGLSTPDKQTAAVIEKHKSKICEEVLATEFVATITKGHSATVDIDGAKVEIKFRENN
jgi:isoleucyl-tRNA synthetase